MTEVSERTRVQLCGRLSIQVDGTELVSRLRGRQVPLLFAYLALHRDRAVARDELAEAMWPDSAPRSQDAALRTLLSRLRAALGPDALLGRDEIGLALAEPVWIDAEAAAAQMVAALEALERGDARAAWALAQVPLNIAARGLLPGVQMGWVDARRRELADLRLQALEVIGRAGLSLGGGQLASVGRAGRALIELEPYRESGYVLLMEALAGQGNAAEALRVYDRLRSLLREELGTAPSAEAIALNERILSPRGGPRSAASSDGGSEATGDGDLPIAASGPLALPPGLGVSAAEPLVGRGEELRILDSWWDDGPERMIVLAGGAGTGKSRLQAALAAQAHASGAIVLAGSSPEETLAPYQPFLEALGAYAYHAPLGDLRAVVRRCGEAAADVARLVPEIRRRLGDLPAAPPADPETDRYRLFEGVAAMLGELASGAPLLVVLDDLHWGGRPTMMLLRHLLRSPQTERVRILGAYRDTEEGSEEIATTLSSLRRDGLVRRLDLGGLSREDAAALVRAQAGGTPSQALYDETDGNPFFILELLRHLREAGVSPAAAGPADLRRAGLPDDVRDLIARRLARLSDTARDLLRDAAVVGREFDAALLEQVVGLPEARFLDALEEALRARLITEAPREPGRYLFSHALVRETLYASSSSARRVRSHDQVGRALEQRGGQVAELAHHFTRAAHVGDAEKAITYALAAGAQATGVLAYEEAADHYERALEVHDRDGSGDEPRRMKLLLTLAEARVQAGERAGALSVFVEVARLAAQTGDRDSLIRAALGAARRFIQPPGLVEEEPIRLLDQALAATAGERSIDRVRLLSRMCGALYYSERRDEMRRLGAEATAIAAELGTPSAVALAASARRRAWWGPGHLERRLADSTVLLRSAGVGAGDLELRLHGHAWLITDLLEAGDRTAVEAQVSAFATAADALRQPLYLWSLRVWQSMLALLDGRLADAERLAEEGLALGIRPDVETATQYHLGQVLAIRREQDRVAELVAALPELRVRPPARPIWRAGLALLLSDLGRDDDARAELAALVDGDRIVIEPDGDWLAAVTMLAQIATATGDRDRAATLFTALRPYAGVVPVAGIGVVCWGAAARQAGRLAGLLGEREQAVELLRRAIDVNDGLGSPVQRAHAQIDLALTLQDTSRAAELLTAAAHTAETLDLPLIARRAREATVGRR